MATSIFTGSTAPGTSASGRSTQGHIQYAINQGAWWVWALSSTNQLAAKYSTDGTTWNTPTGSPFTLTAVHNSVGLNYAFAYASISSTDVLHMNACYQEASGSFRYSNYHSRFTLGTTWSNTNAEASQVSLINYGVSQVTNAGPGVALDSASKPIDLIIDTDAGGESGARRGSNADAGSAWTAGFATETNFSHATASFVTSSALFSLGSGNMLAIFDDGASGTNKFTQIYSSKWTSSWSAAATSLASSVTSADTSGWGACALSASDIHLMVLQNNSNTYTHRRYNGTSWAAGSTVNNLAYGTTSGIAMVSDGTSVWAFACDTSKNIQYSKWTSGGGWGAWTVLEATRTNAPRYVSACMKPDNSAIQVIWTETNGSNFEVWTSQLSTPPTAMVEPTMFSFPSIPQAFLGI